MSTSLCACGSDPPPQVSFITPLDRPWSELVAQWRHLDDEGAMTIWVSDHIFNQRCPSEPWFGGWPALAGMASVTIRARVGMLVSPPALHVPATLAKHIVTVDHISGGRLEVGLGAGGSVVDEHLVLDRRPVESQRLRRFADFVDGVAHLLRPSEVVGSSGAAATLQPPPVQRPHPPLTIAGRSDVALRLAAKHASRWNFYSRESSESLEHAVEAARRLVARVNRECVAVGRDPADLTRSMLLRNAPLASLHLATPDSLQDMMCRFHGVEVDELIFFYPLRVHFPAAEEGEAALLEHLIALSTQVTRRV